MDLNWARSLFTLVVFFSFALVVYVVLSKRNKDNYHDAAQSIMDDEDTPRENIQSDRENGAK